MREVYGMKAHRIRDLLSAIRVTKRTRRVELSMKQLAKARVGVHGGDKDEVEVEEEDEHNYEDEEEEEDQTEEWKVMDEAQNEEELGVDDEEEEEPLILRRAVGRKGQGQQMQRKHLMHENEKRPCGQQSERQDERDIKVKPLVPPPAGVLKPVKVRVAVPRVTRSQSAAPSSTSSGSKPSTTAKRLRAGSIGDDTSNFRKRAR